MPSGHGASEAGGQQGGSSPGDSSSSCPWGACPHAAGWECKEQPEPGNVTVLFSLQVSRGSRAHRGMDPGSSRSPPGPPRRRSSCNKCVSSEVSPWESFLPEEEQPPGTQEESADPVKACKGMPVRDAGSSLLWASSVPEGGTINASVRMQAASRQFTGSRRGSAGQDLAFGPP